MLCTNVPISVHVPYIPHNVTALSCHALYSCTIHTIVGLVQLVDTDLYDSVSNVLPCACVSNSYRDDPSRPVISKSSRNDDRWHSLL